jgi:sn-glycerol 3-phosphate transport system permease protein
MSIQRRLRDWPAHLILLIGVAIFAFPVYVALIGSTHDLSTVATGRMGLTPGPYGLKNYVQAWSTGTGERIRGAPVRQMVRNSAIMALTIATGKIAISIISAFAVAFFSFPGRMFFFWMIFVTLMLPVEVRIIPTYKVVSDLHMINTFAGLTIPLIASATATLIFRQFFLQVPDELVDAAKVDGAGPMRFFWSILLPLSSSTVAALFVILFLYGWNQYLWPLLVTTSQGMETVVIGITKMIGSGEALVDWPIIMATAIMAMIPPISVVILMQRWFVKGLTETEK